jgi:putative ABC transport system permease protein
VTIADRLPLMEHGHYVIGVDAGGAGPMEGQFDGYRVSTAAVAEDFFATFDAAPLAGRLFTAGDYAGQPRVAVVNQSFVDRVLGGRNPIGRHVQYRVVRDQAASQRPPTGANPPWIEIVGLVRDMGMAFGSDPQAAGIYLPLTLSRAPGVYVGARVSGDVAATAIALRHVAARIEPLLRVVDAQPLDQVTAGAQREGRFWMHLIEGVSASALLLALSGIYAVTSFTVSRRTREIGIRVALGSGRLRVVFAILRGPLVRMAIGIAIGSVLIMLLSRLAGVMASQAATLFGYIVVMCVVCLLACLVPARRAMAVDPIEALRAE